MYYYIYNKHYLIAVCCVGLGLRSSCAQDHYYHKVTRLALSQLITCTGVLELTEYD